MPGSSSLTRGWTWAPSTGSTEFKPWTSRQVPLPSWVKGIFSSNYGLQTTEGFRGHEFLQNVFQTRETALLKTKNAHFKIFIGKGNSDKDFKKMKIVFLGGLSFSIRISGCPCRCRRFWSLHLSHLGSGISVVLILGWLSPRVPN